MCSPHSPSTRSVRAFSTAHTPTIARTPSTAHTLSTRVNPASTAAILSVLAIRNVPETPEYIIRTRYTAVDFPDMKSRSAGQNSRVPCGCVLDASCQCTNTFVNIISLLRPSPVQPPCFRNPCTHPIRYVCFKWIGLRIAWGTHQSTFSGELRASVTSTSIGWIE